MRGRFPKGLARSLAIGAVILVLALWTSTAAHAQGAKIKVNWTATSGAMSPLWVAMGKGYFAKNGLDVEFAHITSSSKAIQAMIAGDIAFTTMDPLTVIQANSQGADVRMVVGITNRLAFSLMVQPEIARPEDLKGKSIGITRFGSSTHTATLYFLRESGLEKDVKLLQFQEVPAILAGLMAKQIQGGTVSPPTNSRARKEGFRELINLGVEGPEYPSVAVGTRKAFIDANMDAVRRFVRSYSEGLLTFKSSASAGMEVIKKYTKVDDPSILEDAYGQFARYIADVPYVSVKGMETILAELAEKDPKVRGLKPDAFMDMSFVRELDNQGFYKKH